MEKSIDSYFESVLGAVYSDPKEYSPLSLAYIGDSVYDLLIKTVLVTRMRLWDSTERLQALRLLWDICTLRRITTDFLNW